MIAPQVAIFGLESRGKMSNADFWDYPKPMRQGESFSKTLTFWKAQNSAMQGNPLNGFQTPCSAGFLESLWLCSQYRLLADWGKERQRKIINWPCQSEMQNPENLRPSRQDQTVILVVDDEVMIRNVARLVLERESYFILTAHDGEEALHLSREFPGTIHGVLSDVRMPKMDGLQLRERILKDRPGIPILLMSGCVDAPPPSNVPFLAKPFDPPLLIGRIRQLLASAPTV